MEIDENSQIIRLVRSRPVLYSKCKDFGERNLQWKEVADILKVDVSWIKSRWHILRAKFLSEYSAEMKGRQSNYKYLNEMSFLVDHINMEAFEMQGRREELDTQPEFIITQKDLDEQSDDDTTNIFVELEIENSSNKDLVQTFDLSTEISEDGLEDTLCMSNAEFSQSKPLATQPKYKLGSQSQVETFHILEIREKDNHREIVKGDTSHKNEAPEEPKLVDSEFQRNDFQVSERKPAEATSQADEQTELSDSNSVKPEKHRCEDTIFGELVTATLRRMPNEKKKAVKREIMNILFT